MSSITKKHKPAKTKVTRLVDQTDWSGKDMLRVDLADGSHIYVKPDHPLAMVERGAHISIVIH